MVPDVAAKGHSFKGAFAYYLHDKRQDGEAVRSTSERVAWTETRNLATDDPEVARRVMIATASQADELKKAAGVKATGRKSNQHVYAYSLAWHPDEAAGLDRAEMVRATNASLKALGAEHLQAVVVCHRDQKHPHVHVIINRVDPATGKMHGFNRDREKLSAWAASYERERGLIVTPARQEKEQLRQQFEPAARKAHVDERRKRENDRRHSQAADQAKKPTADRIRDLEAATSRNAAATLKQLGDAQKARHRQEWAKLAADQKARRAAVYDTAGRHIRATLAQAKEQNRPQWAELHREQRAERRRYEQREKRIAGIVRNSIDAVRSRQIRGDGSDRGFLSMAFGYLTSSQARRATFDQGQADARARLAGELKARTDARVQQMKELRDKTLARSREAHARDRAALIAQQNAEREKVREAWRQIYAQRGKAPPSRLQRQERVMRRDFDKARELPVANKPQRPVPTVQHSLSRPEPAPAPGGMPTPAARTVQSMPKVDRAAEWAKTAQGQEALAKDPPPPQSRADYWNEKAKATPPQGPGNDRNKNQDMDPTR